MLAVVNRLEVHVLSIKQALLRQIRSESAPSYVLPLCPQKAKAAEKNAKAAGFSNVKELQKSKQVFKVSRGTPDLWWRNPSFDYSVMGFAIPLVALGA